MKTEKSDLRDRMKAFALRVIKLFAALPKTAEAQVIGRQVLRSGTSVGANYREAYRARSKAEFRAKCGDSLKELEEPSGARQTMRQRCPQGERGGAHQTAYWFELLVEGGIVAEEELLALRQECHELTAIFVTTLKKSKEVEP
jgi:four helix bundle protein